MTLDPKVLEAAKEATLRNKSLKDKPDLREAYRHAGEVAITAYLDAAEEERDKITKFLEAYYTGAAQTFVNPDSGELVSACYHVRSFAAAILRGPTPKRPDVEGTSVSYDAPEPITGT